MNLFKEFHPRRVLLLIRRDLYIQYPTYLVALGAIAGLLFMANAASVLSAESWNFNLVFFPVVLFGAGFAFTSLSFSELNDSRSRTFYLSLPASVQEKLVAKLIVTGPGWAFAWLIIYFLFSAAVYALTNMFFGVGHGLFDPFDESAWTGIRAYLVFHSIFFLGALSFRKNAFLKTVLMLSGLMVGYAMFTVGLAYLFHFVISIGGRPYISFRIFDIAFDAGMSNELREILTVIDYCLRGLFSYAMAPFLWKVAYFRLKEVQVK